MKKSTITIVMVLLGLTVAWCYRLGGAEPVVPSELKVGMVNVAKVLSECQANLDREKQSRAKEQEIKTELASLQAEANVIKQELDQGLEPGSDEFQQQLLKWFEKRAQYKAYGEYQQEAFAARTQAWMEVLYTRLLEEIATVAQAEGISLIINNDEIPTQPQKLTDLTNMILNRKVLYHAPSLDLTGRLLERMNQQHTKKQTITK